LEDFLAAKENIAARYREAFADLSGVTCMPLSKPDRLWLFSILVEDGRSAVERLNAAGIGARRLWRPIHLQPPYADCPRQNGELVVAERLYAEGLSLPSSVGLSAKNQECVIMAIRQSVSQSGTQ